jgi:hypothetical protein
MLKDIGEEPYTNYLTDMIKVMFFLSGCKKKDKIKLQKASILSRSN